MSLINKMLQDLETRSQAPGKSDPQAIYQGLRPTGRTEKNSFRVFAFAVLIGMVVSAGGVSAYVWYSETPQNLSLSTPIAVAPPLTPEINLPIVPDVPPSISAPDLSAEVMTVSPKEAPVVVAAISPAPESIPSSSDVPSTSVTEVIPVEPPKKARSKPSTSIIKPIPQPVSELAPAVVANSDVVLDKKMRPLSAKEKSENYYRQAMRLNTQGRMSEAQQQLTEALSADPEHISARELAAGLALQQGHWVEASRLLQRGIELVPQHYPFVQLLARIYVERGAELKALKLMETSASLAASDPEYISFLATLYQRAGRHSAAISTYTEALKLRSEDGRSWIGLGISFEAEGKWGEAANAYSQARAAGTLTPQLARYAEQRIETIKDK